MANIQTNQNRCELNILPDEVLLEIFGFYMDIHLFYGAKTHTEESRPQSWESLVHVCQRWRSLVFASPRRLNLQLYCTPKTRVKDKLDVWPALPLIIESNMGLGLSSVPENTIAALGQSNRARQVELLFEYRRQMEEVLATMQVPFPELTRMQLYMSDYEAPPIIPDSFLGGSAPPRLQQFELDGIPFPGLPKFLLSATHLVALSLPRIPESGYISPEAIVALLSVLSNLRRLSLGIRSIPHLENQSPQKCLIHPALNELDFSGDLVYLEELVAHIDTPYLDEMHIGFSSLNDIDRPRLAKYINRTPNFRARDEARVQFFDNFVRVAFRYRSSEPDSGDILIVAYFVGPALQLSSIGKVCNNVLDPDSMVEDLYIEHHYWKLGWEDRTIENTLWLQLLLPFTAVKNLYLSCQFVQGVAATLQALVGVRITEVLPSLQNIFAENIEPDRPLEFNAGEFIAARRLSDHPIFVSLWAKAPRSG